MKENKYKIEIENVGDYDERRQYKTIINMDTRDFLRFCVLVMNYKLKNEIRGEAEISEAEAHSEESIA